MIKDAPVTDDDEALRPPSRGGRRLLRLVGWILLVGVCLLLALPVLVQFDSHLMWKVTLGVTEYGHRLAVVLLLLAGLLRWWRRRLMAGMLFATGMVLLLPVMQAGLIASTLPREMTEDFTLVEAPPNRVLNAADLWLGREPQPVEAQRIEYANDQAGGSRTLLFFSSQTRRPAPCLVMLHSGGWDRGKADEFPAWNHHWAREGYAVASIEYRLAPRWRWPAQRDDVAAALAFLKAQATVLGVDATRFVIIGRSAGGQIATASAYSLKDPAIRGCISLYAPGDMGFAWRYADPNDVLDSPRLLRQYLGGGAEDAPELYLSSSGTLIAHTGCPPTLLVHGKHDALVWHLQSERLAAALKKAGVPHHYLSLPWGTHALDYPFNGPGAQLTRYAMTVFLKQVTR